MLDKMTGFFFSSRRRHTRFDCYWSSDVCSSDLDVLELDRLVGGAEGVAGDDLLDADGRRDVARVDLLDVLAVVRVHHQDAADALGLARVRVEHAREIGRSSCRERV